MLTPTNERARRDGVTVPSAGVSVRDEANARDARSGGKLCVRLARDGEVVVGGRDLLDEKRFSWETQKAFFAVKFFFFFSFLAPKLPSKQAALESRLRTSTAATCRALGEQ